MSGDGLSLSVCIDNNSTAAARGKGKMKKDVRCQSVLLYERLGKSTLVHGKKFFIERSFL